MTSSTPTRLRRRLPKKKPDMGEAEADGTIKNAAAALIGEEQSKHYSDGYLTVRGVNRSYVSYAYGEEVMRGDQWGLSADPHPQPIARSASVRRLQQVKNSVAESTRSLAAALERIPHPIFISRQPSKKAKEKETVYKHNPMIVYGRPDSMMETYIQKSKTLSSIVGSVKHLDIRSKPKTPPHRDWDIQNKVYITKSKRAEVFQWTEEQVTNNNEHQLVALTQRQLKELQGKNADSIIYAMPIYTVPPPTPCTSDAGSIHGVEEEDEDDSGEGNVFGRPEDEDPEAEHKYLHKDLRKLLGPYTGFHITPGTTNPDLFFEHNNCSSWYNEPFIIPARDAHSELISFVSMIDQEYERAAATENGYAQGSDIDSDASSNYDQTKNILQRPRSQLAGQALIQYLLFKGIPIHEVAEMLGSLDETFLYKSESRWWNGYRVPQHTQLNDKIVEKVLVIAKAGKEWWEEEYDFQGKRMPKEQVLIHRRMRERKAARFAKMTVENYLWWRLMGQQPHKDVKSGAMMRIGEY